MDFIEVEISYGSLSLSKNKGEQFAVIEGLTNNVEYTFTIKTVDVIGNSSSGTEIKATPVSDAQSDTTPPGDVDNLKAVIGDKKINLTWSDPGDTDFVKVEISLNLETITVNKGVQSALFTGLTNGMEYTFRIKTVDATGNRSSGKEIKATPEVVTVDTTPPAEVTQLNAIAGDGKVTLSWSDPIDSDFASVQITYGSNKIKITKGVQSAVITNLTNDTLYTFKIQTIDTEENISDGIEIESTPIEGIADDTTPPGEVSDLTADSGSTKITLNWTDPTDDDFNKVEISYNSNTLFVNKGIQSREITGLINGTVYTFIVKTLDNSGNISEGVTITKTPSAILVTSVNITKSETTILVGGEETLAKIVLPNNATNPGLEWTSSNTNVATVDSSGKVIGISEGSATITAKSKDGTNISDTCTVTVTTVSVAVTGITLSDTTIDLISNGLAGEKEKTIVATIVPPNATNQNVTWSISPSGIATVSGGVVTAVVDGTATITVTSVGNPTVTATCTVNVKTRYTVSFNTNGGSSIANQNVLTGGKVTQPPTDPTRNGYDFEGWYKEPTPVTLWDFGSDTISSNTTIYAKWTPIIYNITYEPNGGTNGSNPSTYSIESANITLANPTRSGYTFGGWFENSDLSGTAITQIPTGSCGNKIFYAKWLLDDGGIGFDFN